MGRDRRVGVWMLLCPWFLGKFSPRFQSQTSVGVKKDKELKLEDVKAPHTLG